MNKSFKEYFTEKYPQIFLADVSNKNYEDMKEIMRETENLFFLMIEEYENWKKEQ